MRVPWTARRSNQSVLKEISPEYSLEGLMLKVKLQSFGYLMPRANSLEKTLMLRKTEGKRRRGWQRVRWLMASLTAWTWVQAGCRRVKGGSLARCSPWGHEELHTTERLSSERVLESQLGGWLVLRACSGGAHTCGEWCWPSILPPERPRPHTLQCSEFHAPYFLGMGSESLCDN